MNPDEGEVVDCKFTNDGFIEITRLVKVVERYRIPEQKRQGLRIVRSEQRKDPFALTPTEKVVLAAIADGYSNREIAHQRSVSVRTIESHRSNIRGKLGLRSRHELTEYWKENYEDAD